MKKITALMLLICTLICGVSCANNTQETTADPTSSPVVPGEVEGGDTLNVTSKTYDGREYMILVANNISFLPMFGSDYYFEEEGSSHLSSARAKWIADAESKFDIVIETEEKIAFGDSNGNGMGYTAVSNAVSTEDPIYDSCLIGTYDVANLARNGYLTDLGTFDYINLNNSWWDQTANKDLKIMGKMFFTTGDISTIDNTMTACLLFNKEIIKRENLTSPYEYIDNNKWTMDNFISLVKQSSDALAEGVGEDQRKYGLLTWNDAMLHVISAADGRVASVNENGEIAYTIFNERTNAMYQKYTEISKDRAYSVNYQVDLTGDWDANRTKIFNENRALFYASLIESASLHRDSEIDYGFVPYPKYDENQENYGHYVSAWHTSFVCIPFIIEDDELSASVTEYMAYTGQQLTKPAYYDDTLIGKYVRDDESIKTLDIIFASRVYDLGSYYQIGNIISEVMANVQHGNNTSLQQVYEKNKLVADILIASINRDYQLFE